MNCFICPRDCGADRSGGERGFCGCDGRIFAARAALHFWEEPIISGTRGSGAVFFSGCSLRCVYCQNREISRGESGKEVTPDRLYDIFFELKARGAHNINLVTPTHYTLQLIPVLERARQNGIGIPIVWNSGGYEKAEMIASLDKTVDIYLTDFKYMSGELAEKYSAAKDYPETAKEALSEMVRTKGAPVVRNGLMKKGVTLVIVLASARLDMLIGTNYIKDAVIIAFCANELISIIENAGLMGVPIPSAITKAIEVLKEKGDKDA